MELSKNLFSIYSAHESKASDKWSSYFAVYDRAFAPFRDKPIKLLEIGVQNGGSLEIWAKYFSHAQSIIGCDINPICGQLDFDDERIKVVVGSATSSETKALICGRCAEFDLVIDDGSHKSSDIVQAFLTYFPLLSDGGVYLAEDLACSYWHEYQGGLYALASSISFFKLLADYLNRESWGVPVDAVTFFGRNGFDVADHLPALDAVQSVEFSPSMCIIHKAHGVNAGLGERVVAGKDFPVQDAIRVNIGQRLQVPSQAENPASIFGGAGCEGWLQPPKLIAQLYAAPKGGSYSEAASASVALKLKGERVVLNLPVALAGLPVGSLRLDLANHPAAFVLHGLFLQLANGEKPWRWDGARGCFRNVSGLAFRDRPEGLMALCLNNDTQFELEIPDEVRARIGPGAFMVVEITARPLLERCAEVIGEDDQVIANLCATTADKAAIRVTADKNIDLRHDVPGFSKELESVAILLESTLVRRNQTITEQSMRLATVRDELLRAEAQLDLLKDVMLGSRREEDRL